MLIIHSYPFVLWCTTCHSHPFSILVQYSWIIVVIEQKSIYIYHPYHLSSIHVMENHQVTISMDNNPLLCYRKEISIALSGKLGPLVN